MGSSGSDTLSNLSFVLVTCAQTTGGGDDESSSGVVPAWMEQSKRNRIQSVKTILSGVTEVL